MLDIRRQSKILSVPLVKSTSPQISEDVNQYYIHLLFLSSNGKDPEILKQWETHSLTMMSPSITLAL